MLFYFRKFSVLIPLAAISILGLGYFTYTQGLWRFNSPSLQDYPVQGLDVSHHQGDIDWKAVPKDRFQFVYIKASEGGDFKDRKFHDNWTQARQEGFRVGAYHFFTLCRAGGEQANNFIETVPQEPDAMAPVVDLEFVGNCKERPALAVFRAELDDFIRGIKKHYGSPPIFYTTYAFHKAYLEGSDFGDYPIWIRDIFSAPDQEVFPDWLIWQYADNARIPGIEGPVDLNAAR